MPWAAMETVKRTASRTAAARPASRSTSAGGEHRGRHQPDATQSGGGDRPDRPLASSGGELSWRAATGEDLDSALGEPGRGADREAGDSREGIAEQEARPARRRSTIRSTCLAGET